MKDVAGYPITCLGSYGSHASTTDIYDSKSSDYAALGDFTLPFTYQTAEELDSSHILKLKGVYGKYKQDGYNLDVVPNVSPRLLAQQFQACEDFYQQSIDKCAEQQGYAAVPANKTHDGQAGCPSDARPITQVRRGGAPIDLRAAGTRHLLQPAPRSRHSSPTTSAWTCPSAKGSRTRPPRASSSTCRSTWPSSTCSPASAATARAPRTTMRRATRTAAHCECTRLFPCPPVHIKSQAKRASPRVGPHVVPRRTLSCLPRPGD